MIQSGRFLRNILSKLGKKVITDLAIPLAKDTLPGISKQFNFKCNK